MQVKDNKIGLLEICDYDITVTLELKMATLTGLYTVHRKWKVITEKNKVCNELMRGIRRSNVKVKSLCH